MASLFRTLFVALLWLGSTSTYAQSFPPVDHVTQRVDTLLHRGQSLVDSTQQSVTDQVRTYENRTQRWLLNQQDSLENKLLIDTLRQHYDTLHRQVNETRQAVVNRLPVKSNLMDRLPHLPPVPPSVPLPSLSQTTRRLTQRLSSNNFLGQVHGLKTQASQYTQQATNMMQQGAQSLQNAPATLEQQATALPEIQLLQQQHTAQSDWQSQQLSKQTVTNHVDQLPETIRRETVKQATRHFSEHTEAIQQGQQQLGDLKRKYEQVQSEKDKYQRATSLKGRRWTSRLLLGAYFQIYRQPTLGVDLSPFVGYRFNTRWSIGMGGSYRVVLARSTSATPLYQGRAFIENVVYKGFALHAAYEQGWLPPPHQATSESKRYTTQHFLGGIGKTYQITRKIQGTTLLLYRLGSLKQPFSFTRWNLRTGFLLDW